MIAVEAELDETPAADEGAAVPQPRLANRLENLLLVLRRRQATMERDVMSPALPEGYRRAATPRTKRRETAESGVIHSCRVMGATNKAAGTRF
jgi:hypothetical protein